MIEAYKCEWCGETTEIEVMEVEADTEVPVREGVYAFCGCDTSNWSYEQSIKHQRKAADWAIENIRGLT